MLNKKQTALIHVARNKTGMSEDDYRALLAGLGVESSRDLTQRQFDAAMRHFEKLGFTPRRKKPVASKERLLKKIQAQIDAMGLSWNYVHGIAGNMFGISRVQWCSAHQLHSIVAALTYHQKRRQKEKKSNDSK